MLPSLSLLLTLVFVSLAELQQSPTTDESPNENRSTETMTSHQATSIISTGDSIEIRSLNESEASVVKPQKHTLVHPQTYYSKQDAFFRLFNPFMFPPSPGLTCVGVACNQINFGGFLGVETCVGGICNQNNGRKKRSPEAQFGFFDSFKNLRGNFKFGFGGAQKCVGSQCNQNNLEVFNQKQKCFGSQCNQNNEAATGGKLFTPISGVESLVSLDGLRDKIKFGTKQNCVGSQCNQNNVDVGGLEQNCQGSDCNQNNKRASIITDFLNEKPGNLNFGHDFIHGVQQNCVGSNCNQNNLQSSLQEQNCVGSKCNQNNAGSSGLIPTNKLDTGRFDSERDFILGQKQNCVGSDCNQNNVEGLGQKQQCLGSQCNQNNLDSVGQAQTCLGSQCNQNNVG